MRTIAKAIATGAIITAVAITATGCKDADAIDLDTTATNHERLERIHGPIVNKPSGPSYHPTPEQQHKVWQKKQRGNENPYVDLTAIHERNGYNK